MAKSKRAIADNNLSVWIISLILACTLLAFTFWFWQKAVFFAHEKGPNIAEIRLSYLLEREVTVQSLSLTFPLQISIKGINVSPLKGDDNQIKNADLKVKFSIPSFLTGHLKPKEITIFSPEINLSKTEQESFFILANKHFTSLNYRAAKQEKKNWPVSIKPSSWPIIIAPAIIKIVNGKLHLEDESDTMPQIDGQFDLNLQLLPGKGKAELSSLPDQTKLMPLRYKAELSSLPDQTKLMPLRYKLAIKSGNLSLNDTSFFYRGLKGDISGTIQFSSKETAVLLHCKPEGGGTLMLRTKKTTIKNIPRYSFEIKATDYDLKNLALLKFPLLKVSANTVITGNFTAASPLLYGKKFTSFSTGISHKNGAWSIKAINLQLTANHGNIRGSITPGSSTESSLAKATLSYQGDIPPNIQTNEEELIKLNPLLWESPISLTSELSIDLNSYPLQVNSLKITGSNGTFFGKGTIDLFSGFMNMHGTYLKPLLPGKHTSKDIQNIATKVTFSGIVSHPIIQVSNTPQGAIR